MIRYSLLWLLFSDKDEALSKEYFSTTGAVLCAFFLVVVVVVAD